MSAHLTFVDDLVQDVAAGDLTTGHALARLRMRGLTPNPDALDDALTALQARDSFIAGGIGPDPYEYLGTEPQAHTVRPIWELAVERAEHLYDEALRVLAVRQASTAVAS